MMTQHPPVDFMPTTWAPRWATWGSTCWPLAEPAAWHLMKETKRERHLSRVATTMPAQDADNLTEAEQASKALCEQAVERF